MNNHDFGHMQFILNVWIPECKLLFALLYITFYRNLFRNVYLFDCLQPEYI